MKKKHFIHMASIVRAILDGHWTHELPDWANIKDAVSRQPYTGAIIEISTEEFGNIPVDYTRAVWTAEAFIKVAVEHNPCFDTVRFLQACGLVAKPAKGRKR